LGNVGKQLGGDQWLAP